MSKHIILLDNYDSFTYNLYDYFCRLGVCCTVVRNDAITVSQLEAMQPDAIVLSPGPKRPASAGILPKVVQHLHDKIPILGVCLGHQAIGEFFGATLVKATLPMHGKISMLKHNGGSIFKGIERPMQVMRYHSLLLVDLPDCLEGLAYTETGELMALKHRNLPIWGLQFHPESILTVDGLTLLKNWLETLNSI